MGSLAELTFQTSYHKGRDDIAHDFYLPCLYRATVYDRAVGYFRSSIFVIAWPALRHFINRGGKIRILCSQILSEDDIAAMESGYSARIDESLAARLSEEVKGLLSDNVLGAPARILAALIARGSMDIQIVVLRERDVRGAKGRIFHDKLGIFRDEVTNTVIFKGSMNETWSGLAADGNLESIDVAASWMGVRDLERVRNEERYFSDLWYNQYPTAIVRPFPAVARRELESAADADWETTIARLEQQIANEPPNGPARTLMPHQSAGLASWHANNRRGILAFATGSGKTFTAIVAIRDAILNRSNVVVVVVPDQVLFTQWYREIVTELDDLHVKILRAGSGHSRWRSCLRLWTSIGDERRLVLATVQTAATTDFRSRLSGGEHVMLVADEVHRLGSQQHRALLDEKAFGPRLGLSATPERAGDPEGTSALMEYFRGILEPRYTLADAVRDRVLTPYFYRPHTVMLTKHEALEWNAISIRIAQLRARIGGRVGHGDLETRLKHLLIKRARIVKQASAKIQLAVDVLSAEGENGQRWIVYCDDLSQLRTVCSSLTRRGIQSFPFHSDMDGDRSETLRWLERRGGVVVAIKCLDEGVDVPSVTHALILASSKNPREFVQRRGRVLRRSKGKALAFIHDAIVLPPILDDFPDTARADPITAGELARAVEFAQSADNPACGVDLQRIAIKLGIDWRTMLNNETEDAD